MYWKENLIDAIPRKLKELSSGISGDIIYEKAFPCSYLLDEII